MRAALLRVLATSVAVLLFCVPCRAEAPEVGVTADAIASCVESHEAARLSRLREQWLEARAAMIRCAEPACPLALRSDCSAWLDELAATLPTLLIVVERDDDGKQPVHVEIDGQAQDLPPEVGPIELVPGTHTLRFTLGSYPVVLRTIELQKGEKNRVLRVRFTREGTPPAAASPPPLADAPAPPRESRPVPLATYLAAGGALAAFVTSGVLLASALSSFDAAKDSCAPECHNGEREAIDARLLAADIVGGAGIVLGGVGVYTFVTRPVVVDAGAHPAAGARDRPIAAGASLRWRF